MMKIKLRHLIISILHAIAMLLLVFIWLRQPYVADSELETTHSFLEYGKMFDRSYKNILKDYNKKYLFFNVSRDQQLDTVYAEHATNVYTNRKMLLDVLRNLESNPDKYSLIILDIFIDELNTPTDSLLAKEVEKLKAQKKIVTVSYVEQVAGLGTELTSNAFGQELSGISYYGFGPKESFYKQSFQHNLDGTYHKQLALLADELLRNYEAKKPFLFDLFYTATGKKGLYRNLIVPRLSIKNDMIHFPSYDEDSTINAYDLQDVADSSLFTTIWHHKEKPVVIIGDLLLADKHFTSEGMMSGPLIVMNTLAELQNDGNKTSFWHILFLLVSFTIVSYTAIFGKARIDELKVNAKTKFGKVFYGLVFKDVHYLLLFIVTILGLIFFQHYIFILFFAVYFLILEKILFLFKKPKT